MEKGVELSTKAFAAGGHHARLMRRGAAGETVASRALVRLSIFAPLYQSGLS